MPVFDKDQYITGVAIDRRASSMVSRLGHRDRTLPRPASVFAPTHDHPVITPYRQHRSPDCDDYIGIALVIEQALFLKDRFTQK